MLIFLLFLFPKQFGQILSLDSTMIEKPIGNAQHIFKFNVDLHHSFSSLFIYLNIADFTFVGDVVAPILRVVPFNWFMSIKNLKTCIMFQYLSQS